MLKTVCTSQLRAGMYLHRIDATWMSHPFWRQSFALSEQHIGALRQCGVPQVVIDTDRGLDAGSSVDAASEPMPPQAADRESPVGSSASVGKNDASRAVDVDVEARRARRICEMACQGVRTLFSEVRLGKAASLETVLPIVDEIAASIARHPHAMTGVVRIKRHDAYTYMHSVAVCALMIALARELKLSEAEVRDAGAAGLLHDLGKAMVPPHILNKPGPLDAQEWVSIKTHPQRGWDMLANSGASEAVRDAVLHHHERIDGSGYPDALGADTLSLLARMTAVCDVYDAVTSDRPYKAGWHPVDALRKMASWHGQFDRDVLHAFIRCVGIFPIGALVRLESGKLAVVIDQAHTEIPPATTMAASTDHATQPSSAASRLAAPTVKAFFSTRSNERIYPQIIELARPACRDRIVGIENPAHWQFSDLQEMWSG